MLRLAGLFIALIWAGLTGCLTWSSQDDDDDTVDDDDDGSPDDDDVASPVEQSAHGVLALARVSGGPTVGVAGAVFSEVLISPSAEEAAWGQLIPFSIPTIGGIDGYRELELGSYTGPFTFEAAGITAEIGNDSLDFVEMGDGVWGAGEFAADRLPEGSSWTARFDGGGPLDGSHDAPSFPRAPELEGGRLLGPTFFLSPGQGIEFTSNPSDSAEPDVFSLSGEGSPGRAWTVDGGGLSIPANDLPSLDGEGVLFFFQRTQRRLVEVESRSLMLATSSWFVGPVVQLSAEDLFLRPLDPEPGELSGGDVLAFSPDPAIVNPAPSYVIEINGVDHEATWVDENLQITVQDPLSLGSGWLPVEMGLPDGMGRGSIRLGPRPPSCDVDESEDNGGFEGADSVTAGQAICGLIDGPGDEDYVRFEPTLGATYDLSVWARRIGALGDMTLTLFDADGNLLSSNDDFFELDSHLRWTATTSDVVYLRVADQNGEGGPDFLWRLSVRGAPIEP